MGEQSRVSPWAPVADLEAELEALQQKQNRHEKRSCRSAGKHLVELQTEETAGAEGAKSAAPQARITNAERKRRTHRLVLIGTYIEHTTKDDQTKRDRLMKGLDEFMSGDRDRAVFGLQPKETYQMNEATIRLHIEKTRRRRVFSPRASTCPAWSRKGAASPRPPKSPRGSPGRSLSRVSQSWRPAAVAGAGQIFVEPETGLDLLVPISVP